ncbi:hypothetical protein DEO23_13750 [Brachybacterium endophyticum]|uniref:TIGR03089 family protein n=1 Tax=Brachybacterium endophyticum TaxID=2182385 RepID=A0A2U2RGZ4_9MICO|nr:TIGR03089 family protein [Brachybacterium endophyticum]PWH05143.1 hypothetical protein DEO23_13750 [Brachybacterium endophyticum]
MTPTPPPLTDLRALLSALEQLGPRPCLVWYEPEGRIELSGHVLANWVIKSVGHLEAEIMLEADELVVLDLPPHWKRLVLALAAWGLGARVLVPQQDGTIPAAADEEVRVVATDRPGTPLADEADEVLALAPQSLALRFEGDLPALVHDWAREVRAHPDQLSVPLGRWAGPAPAADPGHRLLVAADGLEDPAGTLAALLCGRGIVGSAHPLTAEQAEQEGARPLDAPPGSAPSEAD